MANLELIFKDVVSLRDNYRESVSVHQGEPELCSYFQGKVDLADSLLVYLSNLLSEELSQGE